MYHEHINCYVRNVRNEKTGELLSESTQGLRAKELKEFCDFLTQPLTAENLEATLADYEQSIKNKLDVNTIKRRIKNARKFAEAITKGDFIMNDNSTETQGQDLATPETITQEAITQTVNEAETKRPVAVSSKQGRKKSGNEKKTAKIMIYVEPSLLTDIQDLAYANRSSMVTLITGILEDYISANHDKLEKFRNL